jgi:hypothetical protein
MPAATPPRRAGIPRASQPIEHPMHTRTHGLLTAVAALVAACAAGAVVDTGTPAPGQLAGAPLRQSAARPLADSLVVVELTQGDGVGTGGSTNDQLTVVFSTRSMDGAIRPPVPLFGEDILEEFSVSGRDFVRNQLRFTRRVRDKSFLSARYVRVINHGSDGWAGGTISLTVDDEPILRRVDLRPRRVAPGNTNRNGGIEFFNAGDWQKRSFWELDLQQHRGGVRRK